MVTLLGPPLACKVESELCTGPVVESVEACSGVSGHVRNINGLNNQTEVLIYWFPFN